MLSECDIIYMIWKEIANHLVDNTLNGYKVITFEFL